MAKWLGLIGLAALWVLPGAMAATSSRLDILPDEAARNPSETIDVGTVKPIARPAAQPVSKPALRGNPLWSVPLSALTATEERPIFSASRRPPPRAVAIMPVEETSAPPPKQADAPPPLVLVGAVVGEGDAIAILLDRTDQKVIRLRQGESRAGWSLSAVQPREVTLKQGERSEVLVLQRLDTPLAAAPSPPGVPAAAGGPPIESGKLVAPAAGDLSFAPFVPRSTPKNGESDGL